MKKTISVRHNSDGTATIKIGRYVEHIPDHLSLYETYERIRWAAITADLPLNDNTTEELMRVARGLTEGR